MFVNCCGTMHLVFSHCPVSKVGMGSLLVEKYIWERLVPGAMSSYFVGFKEANLHTISLLQG